MRYVRQSEIHMKNLAESLTLSSLFVAAVNKKYKKKKMLRQPWRSSSPAAHLNYCTVSEMHKWVQTLFEIFMYENFILTTVT
jgi:hypothetical protein